MLPRSKLWRCISTLCFHRPPLLVTSLFFPCAKINSQVKEQFIYLHNGMRSLKGYVSQEYLVHKVFHRWTFRYGRPEGTVLFIRKSHEKSEWRLCLLFWLTWVRGSIWNSTSKVQLAKGKLGDLGSPHILELSFTFKGPCFSLFMGRLSTLPLGLEDLEAEGRFFSLLCSQVCRLCCLTSEENHQVFWSIRRQSAYFWD